MHALMLSYGGSASRSGSYVGANFAVNQSGSSASLSVPAGTATGHTLLAVLRCRGDRTFTIPSGWTLHQNGTVIPLGNSGTSTDSRLYVVSKAFAGESSVAFTQSAAAAYGYALIALDGDVISQAISTTPTITKQHAGTLMLAVHYNSNAASTGVSLADYTNRGNTSFLSGSTYFYSATALTRTGAPTGSNFVNATPNGGESGSWAAEIGR